MREVESEDIHFEIEQDEAGRKAIVTLLGPHHSEQWGWCHSLQLFDPEDECETSVGVNADELRRLSFWLLKAAIALEKKDECEPGG